MSEVYRPKSVDVISCDAITIRIEDYSRVMEVIERSGFNTSLIEREYLRGETQFVKKADFMLQPKDGEYVKVIDASLIFEDTSSKTHDQLASFVYNRLRQHYEEEQIHHRDSNGRRFIVIVQASGGKAVLEVNRIDGATAIVSMRVPLVNAGRTADSDYEEVHQALETWGTLHDAIEFDGPPPKHSKARDQKPIVTICDYDLIRPQPDSWNLWQQLISYESWRGDMNSDALPVIDYDEIDVPGLANLFGPLTDEFVLEALQYIAKSKLAERDASALSAALPISQLDIVNEFARRLR
ncbi:MAG TPA: hypothetical protein PK096_02395 [Candidatus Saccharibacteria bacterium]|nr:hypothetical protein [Candidatus Saccharibacteria bacterium]HRK94194.1 hypothetical protein [Candidatus Saccharibacteria bacterium]